MFDVGLLEILLICVVALLVLGPDKLPGTIRVLGLWIGRMKRSFNNIKSEIEKEVGADEIRRQLRNEEIMEKIKKTKSDFNNSISSVKKEASSVTDSLKPEGLDELKKDFDSVTGKSKPDTKDTPTGSANTEIKSGSDSKDQPAVASPSTPTPTPTATQKPPESGSDTENKNSGSEKSES